MIKLELRLFGGLEIRSNGKLVDGFVSRKADALVAYLACNPTSHAREKLADLLWDDRTPTTALGNLRVLLNSIRSHLVPPIVITRNTVQLNPEEFAGDARTGTAGPTATSVSNSASDVAADIWVDCLFFDTLLRSSLLPSSTDSAAALSSPLSSTAVHALEHALTLYQGEFLAGFHLREAQQFDDWASLERERYHILAVKTAQTLVNHYKMVRAFGAGVTAAQRWIQFDPFNDQAHQHFMELLVYAGQRATALDHYQQYVARLATESLRCSDTLDSLYLQIARDELSAQADALQTDVIAGAVTGGTFAIDPHQPIPHNLPAPLTPLIGRENELAVLQSRLTNVNCRLLTITGLGGVGKTHLAIEALHQLLASDAAVPLFCDGIYLIRLDRVEPEQLLSSVIAGAINLTFQGALDAKVQLFRYLRGRHMLLLLDNFEHLVQHADFLDELLQQTPHLKLLITSRERLDFIGEWLLPIEGLPHPPANRNQPDHAAVNQHTVTDAAKLKWHEYPATQLFIHTAKALKPYLDVTEEATAIIDICATVEGLPLGIQLAAATIHVHNCHAIAAALQHNLDAVNTKLRNLPARHRGLRAAFDHSWQLLTPTEQQTFADLAVFRDGFSAESAQLVAEIPNTTLVQLHDKSLVQQLENLPTVSVTSPEEQRLYRYRLHPVLHQYAAEQLLHEPTHEATLRRRHCLFFRQFIADREEQLSNIDAGVAADEIRLELENIRAGWRYALEHRLEEDLLVMLPPLIRFYLLRGYLQDALAMVDTTIDELDELGESTEQITTQASAQHLAQQQNLAQRQMLLANLLVHKAEIQTELGQYEAAFAVAAQAIVHAKSGDNIALEALGYLRWGTALNYHGDYRQAKQKLTIALDLAQGHALLQTEARVQRQMGVNSFYQGDYTGGRLQHEAAIRYYQQTGNLLQELRTYHSLAMLYFYTGDYLQARRHYVRCRELYQEVGDRPALAMTLNNLGAVSMQLGDYTGARHDFEEALAIRRQIGDRQMEGLILANLGLLMHLMNQQRQAVHYCAEALDVSLEIGERDTEAYARTCLAHAQLELGQITNALTNYELAIGLRKAADQYTQMLEPLAGLARTYLRRQEPQQARQHVEEILAQLDLHTNAGIVELIRIYLTCYRVLYLAQDSRAEQLLKMGHTILQERAQSIVDDELRQLYLENVIAHRELLTEFETRFAQP